MKKHFLTLLLLVASWGLIAQTIPIAQTPEQYEALSSYYQEFVQLQLKEYDYSIPANERILLAPSSRSLAQGNWGAAWHQTAENRQWVRDNAQRKVVTYVLDTGAGFSHDGLTKAWWRGMERTFTGEQYGIDRQSHSTHVSGIIAGIDQQKPIGLADELVLMDLLRVIPYKVLNDQGSAYTSWIVAGIESVIQDSKPLRDQGYFVIINLSLGGRGQSAAMDAVITRAEQAGILVLAAAGNGGSPNVGTPANGPDAVAVAAHDQQGNKANFSDYGPEIETAGAGVRILSFLPNNQEGEYSGTSMATPSVAALAAIIASCYPEMDADAVKNILFTRAFDPAPEGRDDFTGHGSFQLGRLIADPPNGDDPDTPDNPDPPSDPDPPVTFTSTVDLTSGDYVFRYRKQNQSTFDLMQVEEIEYTITCTCTEEQAHDTAIQFTEDYFNYTAMVTPDTPEFGYSTTIWWIGQFMEYQARQKRLDVQLSEMVGKDQKGRRAIATGFDRAGFRQTRGGAILLNLRE